MAPRSKQRIGVCDVALRLLVIALVVLAQACGSSAKMGAGDASLDGVGGGGGSAGAGGGGSGGGSGGGGAGSGSGGSAGAGGATGSGGTGTQPIGAACANSGNCSQADGTAVCCLPITTCVLDTQCPAGTNYVSCETQPCTKAGWVCCNAGGMHFCTKQSACP
jgi:hypothetical protein